MRHLIACIISVFCLSVTLPALAAEFVDRDPGTAGGTARAGMHACPVNAVVTGADVVANNFLCLGDFNVGASRPRITGERTDGPGATVELTVWPPDPATRAQHDYAGPAMHWCGPNRFITGIHVTSNWFLCSTFSGDISWRLGRLSVGPGVVRSGIRACTPGTVLVGAHFDQGIFLCAELPFCTDDSQCSFGRRCEKNRYSAGPDAPLTGVCRPRGIDAYQIRFRSELLCRDQGVGSLTDRSGNGVDFTDHPQFDNDEAKSLLLRNANAGTIIRIFDNSQQREDDDFTEILVKTTTTANYCVRSLEPTVEWQGNTFSDGVITMKHTHRNGLEGKVSAVKVHSAIISRGGNCVDVNMNNFTVQLFTCHGGPNQRWERWMDGTIRGVDGRCLEADADAIRAWQPSQPRSAAIKAGACSGAANQIWTMTRDQQQLRLFTNMCLDIPNNRDANNTVLQVYPCHSGINQRWLNTF